MTKKVWYCENGHHNMGKTEPTQCSECESESFDLAVGSWPIITTLPRMGGLLHNRENPCGEAPSGTSINTDLATAAQADVRLCTNCEWPEGAEEVLENDDA